MATKTDNPLGAYLKDRRTRLDPAELGLPMARRRTPGLRREEVAARANVSATWYTWLEQGRGGAPSAEVIDQIAQALMLTEVEREHLFLLALGRLPDVRYRACEAVTPLFQRMIDAMELSPVLVRTPTWDVVAWNRAAAAVLTDYASFPWSSAISCARSSATRESVPHSRIGKASQGSWLRRFGPTSHEQARRMPSNPWSTTFVGSAPSSR
jgi:transcriptional regulator with XRE-family HTH domain